MFYSAVGAGPSKPYLKKPSELTVNIENCKAILRVDRLCIGSMSCWLTGNIDRSSSEVPRSGELPARRRSVGRRQARGDAAGKLSILW